ncbi:MAG: hypothetical protein QOC62_4126 [Mycobacterium sp.]|jgi:hypothetical protein|nr:hypothetical protein [Mycobacterium sp.]
MKLFTIAAITAGYLAAAALGLPTAAATPAGPAPAAVTFTVPQPGQQQDNRHDSTAPVTRPPAVVPPVALPQVIGRGGTGYTY